MAAADHVHTDIELVESGSHPKPVLLGNLKSESQSDAKEARKENATSDGDAGKEPIDRKIVWGLYCMYALVGLVNGFFQNFINIPFCQFVFGPMNSPGRSSVQQCDVAPTVVQMPWNFKLFYAIFLDRVGFLGTRRRGWIIFGWTVALILTGILSFFADNFATTGNFTAYTIFVMLICVFYMFADVAGDGMTIELTKFESEETRGYILTTGQMVRFVMNLASNFIGMFLMNGKSYAPPNPDPDALIFPFEISFGYVHLLLFGLALPFWGLMVWWIRDPPKRNVKEHEPCGAVAREVWCSMKSKVMLFLVIQNIGSLAIASLQNPAYNIIAGVAAPTTFQYAVGSAAGMLLFLIGVWIFRAYFMNRNWRLTFVWTSFLNLSNLVFNLLVVFNAWGIGQGGWFFAIGGALPSILQGIAQVLASLAIAEISPDGSEATVYEFLTTMHNAAIALNANIMNIFVPVFQLDEITRESYVDADSATKDVYNSRMANATYLTMVIQVVGVLVFMWFMPVGKAMCHAWLADKRWHRPSVGVLTLAIAVVVFSFSTTVSFLSMFPETMCLEIAGGSGC